MLDKVDILEINKLVFEYIINLDEATILELLKNQKKLLAVEIKDNVEINITNSNGQTVNKKKNNVNKKEKIIKDKENKKDENSQKDLIVDGSRILSEALSREEAFNYLNKKMYTVKILKDIAKSLNVYIKSKSNKAEIIEKLVENTIGARLKIKALKND